MLEFLSLARTRVNNRFNIILSLIMIIIIIIVTIMVIIIIFLSLIMIIIITNINLSLVRLQANNRCARSFSIICLIFIITSSPSSSNTKMTFFLISNYDYKWLAVCVLSHGRRVANVDQIIGCDGMVSDDKIS